MVVQGGGDPKIYLNEEGFLLRARLPIDNMEELNLMVGLGGACKSQRGTCTPAGAAVLAAGAAARRCARALCGTALLGGAH